MNQVNLGYKLIALGAVFGAIYSCSSSVSSQGDRSTVGALIQVRESIDALTAEVSELKSQVASLQAESCSTAQFLNGECELPDGAAMTTSFCFSQGRSVDLGGKFGLESNLELEGGGGWPNVAWVKGTAKVATPIVLAVPPFILPTEIAGEASGGLGRGVDLCVDVPIEPNDSQRALLADLVTGANLESGVQAKYRRRANRVLNFAALRTPVAEIDPNAPGTLLSTGSPSRSAEEADDAFDIADEAVERFLANGFQPQMRAADVFADPIFRDLAASVDLPAQITQIIDDPQQAFLSFQSLTPATACTTLGIDASLRQRFPEMNALCNRIAALPQDQMLKSLGSTLSTLQNGVNAIFTGGEMRNFICNTVTLRVLFSECAVF